MRRRKARPGTTTRHVKFNKPISDRSSFRQTERRAWKFCNIGRHFWSSSSGRRASWRTESSVIPANCKTVAGPIVFSGAKGTPRYCRIKIKLSKSCSLCPLLWAMNKKSSKICKTAQAPRRLYGQPFECRTNCFKNSTGTGKPHHREAPFKVVHVVPL